MLNLQEYDNNTSVVRLTLWKSLLVICDPLLQQELPNRHTVNPHIMRMPVVSLTKYPKRVRHIPGSFHNPRAGPSAAGEHVASHTSTATVLTLKNLVLG